MVYNCRLLSHHRISLGHRHHNQRFLLFLWNIYQLRRQCNLLMHRVGQHFEQYHRCIYQQNRCHKPWCAPPLLSIFQLRRQCNQSTRRAVRCMFHMIHFRAGRFDVFQRDIQYRYFDLTCLGTILSGIPYIPNKWKCFLWVGSLASALIWGRAAVKREREWTMEREVERGRERERGSRLRESGRDKQSPRQLMGEKKHLRLLKKASLERRKKILTQKFTKKINRLVTESTLNLWSCHGSNAVWLWEDDDVFFHCLNRICFFCGSRFQIKKRYLFYILRSKEEKKK